MISVNIYRKQMSEPEYTDPNQENVACTVPLKNGKVDIGTAENLGKLRSRAPWS